MWWDDGAARGTYVGGIGTTLASHVSFTGQATIMPGWYAGYVLTLEADEKLRAKGIDLSHSFRDTREGERPKQTLRSLHLVH